MKTGIYMGSFNPPHKGHINIVNYILKNKIVDRVIIVPTLSYWNKNNLVNIKDRINMLKYFENEHIIIDCEHNKYTKTYELLSELEKKYPMDTFYPIIGADNLIHFNKWDRYQELLKYSFIVIPRDNIACDDYLHSLKMSYILLKDFPKVSISSTILRENLDNEYLDERVKNYIKSHHLYQKEVLNEKKN